MNPQSHGHPLTVAAVIGALSLALGLAIHAAGLLRAADEGILRAYVGGGFPLEVGAPQPGWGFVILATVVFGLALLLLETPGTGRRILLGATVLVLAGAASPIVGLWGIFWSPLATVVAGAWSAFCATLWALYHPMPCEREDELIPGVVIPLKNQGESGGREVARKKAGR